MWIIRDLRLSDKPSQFNISCKHFTQSLSTSGLVVNLANCQISRHMTSAAKSRFHRLMTKHFLASCLLMYCCCFVNPLSMTIRLQLSAWSYSKFSSLLCIMYSAAPKRPYGNRKIQPPQHDEAEHQSIDPVLTESGQDAGLRLPSPTAVLLSSGALPQTWVKRWASQQSLHCWPFELEYRSIVKTSVGRANQIILILSTPTFQPRNPSSVRTSPFGDLLNWLRGCVRNLLT